MNQMPLADSSQTLEPPGLEWKVCGETKLFHCHLSEGDVMDESENIIVESLTYASIWEEVTFPMTMS